MKIPEFLEPYKEYFEGKPPLLRSAKVVQILLVRETHDYTIFRTEETRELNIVTLPANAKDPTPVVRVVMLASKQKAVESREFVSLWRTLATNHGVQLDDAQQSCSLKDRLCLRCPRCVLFGAVSTESGKEEFNIKHRIEYSSAYSLESYEDISEIITFNAVDSARSTTDQALGYTENITPIAHFASIVTLVSPTWKELVMVLKTLLAAKSYGAETRIKGDMQNHVVGIVFGMEEIITPLEFMLELAARDWKKNALDAVKSILEEYKNNAAFPGNVKIIAGKDIEKFMDNVRNFNPTAEFVKELTNDALEFYNNVKELGKKKGKSKEKKK